MKSDFDGGFCKGALLTTVTLGICYPWSMCKVYEWEAKHTVIDGHRLDFDVKGGALFGQWIKWFFLH